MTAEDRFWNKIQAEPNTGCWLWDAYCDQDGYGMFWNGAAMQQAHRFSFQFLKGPIPEGLQIDHLCRVRSCVNPDHLEAVTLQENISRGKTGIRKKEKTHCPQGHPYEGYNLYVSRGKRYCRKCRGEHDKTRRKRQIEQNARNSAAIEEAVK